MLKACSPYLPCGAEKGEYEVNRYFGAGMKELFFCEINDSCGNLHKFNCSAVWNDECGFWCGYVHIDKNNGLYGLEYSDYEIHPDVHGGVTYTGYGDDSWGLWAIGFDCGHYNDKTKLNKSGIERNLDFVKSQCRILAEFACCSYEKYLRAIKNENFDHVGDFEFQTISQKEHNELLALAANGDEYGIKYLKKKSNN